MSELNFFKNKKPDFKNLLKFGFREHKDHFSYETTIADKQFLLTVNISKDGTINSKVIDLGTNEPYFLHLTDSAKGKFVGKIRTEYENILSEIEKNCFEFDVFKTKLAKECIEYIKDKFNSMPEYLWDKYPHCAAIRRNDNKKWFCLILSIQKNKINMEGSDLIEILDLRMEKTEKDKLLKKDGYCPAYHMNKNSWFTVVLDGRVSKKEIFSRIDKSFELAKK